MHEREISDLVQAAAYCHHHEAAPDHDHDAKLKGLNNGLRPVASSIAVLPAPVSLAAKAAERSFPDSAARRGPPIPLFTHNCALLL